MMFSGFPVMGSLMPAALFLASSVAAANYTFTLAGFGTGISGEDPASIFYADGVAYVGNGSTSSFSVVTDISFTTASSGFSSPFLAVPENTTFSEPKYLAVSSTSQNSPLVIVSDAEAVADNVTTAGFGFYGDSLFWESSSGTLEGGWWAKPTAFSDLWAVYFDPNGDSANDSAVVFSIKYISV